MIQGQNVVHLYGSFKREYPVPEKYSFRDGDKWFVVSRGPKYINQYRVTKFDDAGERWLKQNERAAEEQIAAPCSEGR